MKTITEREFLENHIVFTPRVGNRVSEGIRSKNVLLVTASIPCVENERNPNNVFIKQCKTNGNWCRCTNLVNPETNLFDTKCPCYCNRQNQEYYRLRNSTIIEMDSFLERDNFSRSYSNWGNFMIELKEIISIDNITDFYEHVTVYTYCQNMSHIIKTVLNASQTGNRLQALNFVIGKCNPDVIIVWGAPARNEILPHFSFETEEKETQFNNCLISVGNRTFIFTPHPSNYFGCLRKKKSY